ncbi:MAG: hypothetical protein RL113_1255 [Pseudomonadota bacterium]|jgi:exopolyphosphatase/pppGpp-phosphohydrolase
MQFSRLFHIVLIALFLFAFQTNALHIKHHLSNAEDSCQVCQLSQHLDGDQHHSSSTNIVLDAPIMEITAVEERVIIKEALELVQKIEVKRSDVDGLKVFHPHKPILTYQALAPPLFFS